MKTINFEDLANVMGGNTAGNLVRCSTNTLLLGGGGLLLGGALATGVGATPIGAGAGAAVGTAIAMNSSACKALYE